MYLSTLMLNFDHTVCLALSIPFYMAQPYKALIFEKFIFELEAIYNSKSLLVSFVLSKNNKIFRSSQTYSWTPYFPMLSFPQRLVCVPLVYLLHFYQYFLFHRKNLVLLHLIRKYSPSTSA